MPEIIAARFQVPTRSALVRLAELLERLSCIYADVVVTANDGIRMAVTSRGVSTTHMTTVYSGGEKLQNLPSPQDVRVRYHLPQAPTLVHAGGVNPERDLETLLRALADLRRVEPLHLAIAGDGEAGYVASLRELTGELGLQDRVHFLGRVPRADALGLMRLSVCGIITLESNPLTQLAWPTRVMEFVELGKPLVVPNLQFLHRTLGEVALYYSAGDRSSLAGALEQLLDDPVLGETMVSKARALGSTATWGRGREALLSIYQGEMHRRCSDRSTGTSN